MNSTANTATYAVILSAMKAMTLRTLNSTILIPRTSLSVVVTFKEASPSRV